MPPALLSGKGGLKSHLERFEVAYDKHLEGIYIKDLISQEFLLRLDVGRKEEELATDMNRLINQHVQACKRDEYLVRVLVDWYRDHFRNRAESRFTGTPEFHAMLKDLEKTPKYLEMFGERKATQ